MKKWLFVLVIVAAMPILAFADLKVGVVGMYNGDPMLIEYEPDLGPEDFTYGLDARLNIGLIEGSLAAMFFSGYDYYDEYGYYYETPDSLYMLTDVGVTLKFLFFRFGAGIGPNFFMMLDDGTDPFRVGVNMKVHADIELGKLSLGLVFFYIAQEFEQLKYFEEMIPTVGLTALYKLF